MSPLFLFASLGIALTPLDPVSSPPKLGLPVPPFTLSDSEGSSRSLSEFAGKTVVLEWHNPECPFVKKHYGSDNMQAQQREATAGGVVWLTVNSAAPGKQGYLDATAAQAIRHAQHAAQTAYLLDAEGSVGHAFGAKTTPHLFIIDGRGVLRYAGAIDSMPSTDPADIPGAKQYVRSALAEITAGKLVTEPLTQPYGCSVKY